MESIPTVRHAAFVARIRAFLLRGDGIPMWLAVPAILFSLTLLVTQASTLRFPIMDEHRWREADTYSVAYNFVHGSFDFFHPRTDVTHGRSGITGMEPPIVPFVAAVAMRVFGDAPSVARVVVWLTALVGLVALLLLMRRIRDTGLAVGVLVAFTLSPLALFELRQIQPDGPTVMLAGAAAFFLYRFASTERPSDYALGVAAFTLSVLVKGPGLVLLPAMAWFACAVRKVSFRQFVVRSAGLTLPAPLYALWDLWAHHLTHVYNADFPTFAMDVDVGWMKAALVDQKLLHHIFWYLVPAYATNWLLFPALLVGLAAAFQPATRRASTAFLLWLITSSVFLAAFSPRLRIHWYYADLALAPLVYFAGFGLAEMFGLFANGRRTRAIVERWAALVVLASLVLPRLVVPVSAQLTDAVGGDGPHPDESWMSDGHLTVLLFLLVLMMVLTQVFTERWVRTTAYVLLPFAMYWGLWRARHDAVASLLVRTHASDEQEYRQHWLSVLRPIVNSYSTRADFFLVSLPENAKMGSDPFYLNLPLRRGWSEVRKQLAEEDLSSYQRAGARFLLNLSDQVLPQEKTLARLASTKYFRLYCLESGGLPAAHEPALASSLGFRYTTF